MRASLLIIVVTLLAGASPARAGKLPREILGIRPGMTEHEAEERLERIATKNPERERGGEAEEGETWTLRDHPLFTYVYLAIDGTGHVRVVQAFGHATGRRLHYSDLGDLRKARRLGFWIYRWDVPSRGHEPSRIIVARGTDSTYVGNYFISYWPSREPPGESGRRAEREDNERREAREKAESEGRGSTSSHP